MPGRSFDIGANCGCERSFAAGSAVTCRRGLFLARLFVATVVVFLLTIRSVSLQSARRADQVIQYTKTNGLHSGPERFLTHRN
jgi:hypothetical protein